MPTATEEQIDAALDEAQGERVTVETPDGPVEFGTPEALPDPDPEAIAVAEHEGLPPVPEASAEAEAATVVRDRETEGLRRIFKARSAASEAFMKHAEADRKAKALKKKWEGAVEELDAIISDVESDQNPLPLEAGGVLSDPRLHDGVNAMFPKPDGIPPLPADDFDEEYRRRANATRLDGLGLKAATVAVLHAEGLHTMGDVTRHGEAGKRLDLVKNGEGSITEKRLTEVSDKLADIGMSWKAEWDAAHPEATPEAEATEAPAEPEEVSNAEA